MQKVMNCVLNFRNRTVILFVTLRIYEKVLENKEDFSIMKLDRYYKPISISSSAWNIKV